MKVEFLILPNGKAPAEEFLQELDKIDRKAVAKIKVLIERLEENGRLTFPHAKKLESCGDLWELRIRSDKKAIRIFYVYMGVNSAVLISGFIKKSQKTPKSEIKRALGYLKQAGIIS